jgi:hypothetical protein
MYNNVGGGSTFDFSVFDTPKTTTTTPAKTAKFDWGGLSIGLLNTGGTIYASEQQRKIAQKQADALIAQGVSQERIQQLILEGKRLDLETAKAGGGAGTGAGSKTLYIALGVGAVVILGVVIFAVTRKKA